MADLSAGAEFAGCRIQAVAGRGGMGVVYRAVQLALDRPVALKVIAPDLARDDAFRARFQREARIAASIEHPNVLPVYEAGEREGVLFMITRYVEGTDLRALLRQEGPLETPRAAELLVPVALALHAAHTRGLVHRDVKPANVLIAAPMREDEHVYLTDFGIARGEGTAGGEMTVTRTGAFVGTLDYMAPERMTGARGDARADVYAFGCMLFEVLAGYVPFPRQQEVARIHAHVNEAFPTLLEIRPDLPPAVDAVAQRACAKNPDDRFTSAAELASALRDAAAGRAAPTAETLAPAGPPTAPHEPPTAELALSAPDAADAATARVPRPLSPRTPSPEPPVPTSVTAPTSSRRGRARAAIIGLAALGAAVAVAVVALSSGDSSPSTKGSTAAARLSASNGAPGLTADSGPTFTIQRPRAWTKHQGPTGGYVEETIWTDPGRANSSVRVDALPRPSTNAQARAENQRSRKAGDPRYTQVSFKPTTIGGRPAVAWVYRIGATQYVDYFFNLDCRGYAVLGQAPSSRFPSLASTYDAVARSVRPTGC